MKTIFGPVRLARRSYYVKNSIVVFTTRGDHDRHYWHIVALKMQLLPSGTLENEDAVEVEEDGRKVLECLDNYPEPCEA
jgi:hypothetical protein